MLASILNPIAIFLSLTTATGLLIHDMRIDKAFSTALSAPSSLSAHDAGSVKLVNFSSDLHTHTERGSLGQVVNALKTPNPTTTPRALDDRKEFMAKHKTRGHHAFDNYSLPIV